MSQLAWSSQGLINTLSTPVGRVCFLWPLLHMGVKGQCQQQNRSPGAGGDLLSTNPMKRPKSTCDCLSLQTFWLSYSVYGSAQSQLVSTFKKNPQSSF